jgi:transcriptional regulator with XRE-family HTH domain
VPPAEYGQGLRELIKGVLDARRMTVYKLGVVARVDRSIISRYLNRESSITADHLERLFGALGLRVVETGRARKTTRSKAAAGDDD